MKEIENIIEITHKELEEVIEINYEKKLPTMIWGRMGIGKSWTVREACRNIAKKYDLEFTENEQYINSDKHFLLIDRRASMMESSDIQGIPFPFVVIERYNQQNSYLSTIPVQQLYQIKEQYRIIQYKTLWCKPAFLPIKGYGIIFADEIPLSPPLVQSSWYQLIYDRKVADYTLPENYIVIGAGNLEEDMAYQHKLAGPLLNRFTHYKLKIPEVEEFTEWGSQNRPELYLPLDSRILAYLNARGKEHLFKYDSRSKDRSFPSPRTWHYTSRLIKNIPTQNIRLIKILTSSCIGCGEAHEFCEFLRIEHKLKPIEYYFKNPVKCELPEEISHKYFLIGSIVDYYGRKVREYQKDKKKQVDLLDRYVKLINRFEPEFVVLTVKLTRGVDSDLRDKLYNLKGCDDLIERLAKYFQ